MVSRAADARAAQRCEARPRHVRQSRIRARSRYARCPDRGVAVQVDIRKLHGVERHAVSRRVEMGHGYHQRDQGGRVRRDDRE